MAMVVGSVSVDSNEVVSGTGLSREIYDADAATTVLPTVPTLNDTSQPFTTQRPAIQSDLDLISASRVTLLQEVARRANAYASAIVPHITGNARTRIKTTDQFLQRTPDPNNANTDTQGPSADRTLNIE